MIFEDGYWNYYISFRIADNKKLWTNIALGKYNEKVIAIALESHILVNPSIEEYFQSRQDVIQKIREQKREAKWDRGAEENLYVSGDLPEFYFDFLEKNGVQFDTLKQSYCESVAEINEIGKVFNRMTKQTHSERWMCMALMPLKIEMQPFEYQYCPVFLYLFENGSGVIRVSIRTSQMDTSFIATYPMKKWFGNVKVWNPILMPNAKKEYKICSQVNKHTKKQTTDTITVITWILQQCVYGLFEGNLLDEKRFSCFETFVIADMKPRQLWEMSTKASAADQEAVFRMARPEDFMVKVTSQRWHDFWKENYVHFNGFDIVKGHNCRMIISTDAELMKKQFCVKDNIDFASYMEASFQKTFDLFIAIALCQKDIEIYLSREVQHNIHNLDKSIATYNKKQIFFEDMLALVPHNARAFYSLVREINDKSFLDVSKKIERIKQIEEYQRRLFSEKRTLLIEGVALIGSVLFGLPMILDTVSILKEYLIPEMDFFPGDGTRFFAVVIWVLLIASLATYLIITYKQYARRKNVE